MTGVEKVLVHDWFQQFPSHSIGSLVFGVDGALYVSGGEGASWQFTDYGQIGNPGGDPPVPVARSRRRRRPRAVRCARRTSGPAAIEPG